MIEAAGLHATQSLLHVIESVGVAIESGKIQPGASASLTGGDGGTKFLLRHGGVFVSLGYACFHPVSRGRIKRSERLSLGAGFIFAAADDSGSFQIKLSEVGASVPVIGRELHSAFESGATLPRQSCGFEKIRTIRFLAIDAAEPEMIEGVLGRQGNSFFARGNTAIPIVEFEMSAAEQVVGFRVGRNADLLLEGFNGLIDAAGGEKSFRRFGCAKEGD